MDNLLVVLIVIGGMIGLGVWFARSRLNLQSSQRLLKHRHAEEEPEAEPIDLRPVIRRNRLLPWLIALICAGLAIFFLNAHWGYTLALSFVVGLLLGQADAIWFNRQKNRLENQLADSLDLMVASLKAGAGVQQSLEYVSVESPQPFRGVMEELVGRIRYGDNVQEVLSDLVARVPFDTFRLFATTLSANWQTGGSLVRPLANVARVIRDRIEIARRVQSMTAQARLSIVNILGVTYFLGALMWRNDPERMGGFLFSTVGQSLVIAAITLQGIGIVWISRLSRVQY